jgi:hypothetical protein
MKFISGKLVIIVILTLAFSAAGASWWFRYAATHRAAEFWGPIAAQRIRDSRSVQLYYVIDDTDLLTPIRNISNARGLTHLRHALLEDRSFVWPAHSLPRQPHWHWAIGFGDQKASGMNVVMFTEDCKQAAMGGPESGRVVSCEPIAKGLTTIFAELSQQKEPTR